LLSLGKLQTAEARWIINFFAREHSVLGGDSYSADIAQAQSRAMMVAIPLGFLRQFIEVASFVVALVITKNLVETILGDPSLDASAALRGITQRFREISVFSIKYMVGIGLFGGCLALLSTSPLTSPRFHDLAMSKPYLYPLSLVCEACLAWLLLPATIRLLRQPSDPGASWREIKLGTVFVVATSAASLVLQPLVAYAERGFIFENRWAGEALSVVNTLIFNAPQALLFVALALLALQSLEPDASLVAEPVMDWRIRFFDLVRRAREWRSGPYED
jgi:hypothetical protein